MKITNFCNVVLTSLFVCSFGCASTRRSLHCDSAVSDSGCDSLSSVQVAYGKQRPAVDAAGWVLGIPSKVLLWDRRANNHSVSEQTVTEVANYLEHRQLSDTLVRVNQYAPLSEWQRLVNNRNISPGWKYTVGSIKWLKYTVVPGRLFGKDDYNPYTNSLSLYSDMPTLGLAEAAYAKDVATRELPGTYAAVQELPVVALWHETLATDEVINYVSIHGSSEQANKIRHDLYARYGIETGGAANAILPDGGGLYQIVGAIGGHTVAALDARKETVR